MIMKLIVSVIVAIIMNIIIHVSRLMWTYSTHCHTCFYFIIIFVKHFLFNIWHCYIINFISFYSDHNHYHYHSHYCYIALNNFFFLRKSIITIIITDVIIIISFQSCNPLNYHYHDDYKIHHECYSHIIAYYHYITINLFSKSVYHYSCN